MIGWIVRILLVVAGFITSLFISREELNFDIIQMVVAVLLFTFAIIIIVFWPMLKAWSKRIVKKQK